MDDRLYLKGAPRWLNGPFNGATTATNITKIKKKKIVKDIICTSVLRSILHITVEESNNGNAFIYACASWKCVQ